MRMGLEGGIEEGTGSVPPVTIYMHSPIPRKAVSRLPGPFCERSRRIDRLARTMDGRLPLSTDLLFVNVPPIVRKTADTETCVAGPLRDLVSTVRTRL